MYAPGDVEIALSLSSAAIRIFESGDSVSARYLAISEEAMLVVEEGKTREI